MSQIKQARAALAHLHALQNESGDMIDETDREYSARNRAANAALAPLSWWQRAYVQGTQQLFESWKQ